MFGFAFGCPPASAAVSCSELAKAKLDNVDFLSSTEVAADSSLPAYCRVLGPAINFDIRLPVNGWNGKFYEVGCGGYCGTVDSDLKGFCNAPNYALRRSYAVASTDAGHWGNSSWDGRWAFGNLVAKDDWAWRAEHEVARVRKALIAAYYGTPLTPGGDSILGSFAEDYLKYIAFVPDAGPLYTSAQFNFDKDLPRLSFMSKVYNATTFNPNSLQDLPGTDLSSFAKHGGKLLIYHGWADMLVTPRLTTLYCDALAKHAGGLDRARDFARLFLIPGMDHCGVFTNGPGIADMGIDMLGALEEWVEKGKAPDEILATKTDEGGASLWQRPVWAWPQIATYKNGNPKAAASYDVRRPKCQVASPDSVS
jgi:hypothetical protein